MNIITWIDAKILQFFQFISDCVAALSGDKVDNFVLAHMCLIVSLISRIEISVIKNIISELSPTLFLISVAVYGIMYLMTIRVIPVGKNSCKSDTSGFKNTLESDFCMLRIIFLVILSTGSIKYIQFLFAEGPCPVDFEDVQDNMKYPGCFANLVDMFFFCFFMYFTSCTPKPPSKNKVKKWLDRLFAPKECTA